MKRLVVACLLIGALGFSGFIGLDLRPTFSYAIFSSPYYKNLKKNLPAPEARIGYLPLTLDAHARQNLTFMDAKMPQLMQAMNIFLGNNLKMEPLQMPAQNELANEKNLPDLFLGSVLGPQKPMYVLADCPQ